MRRHLQPVAQTAMMPSLCRRRLLVLTWGCRSIAGNQPDIVGALRAVDARQRFACRTHHQFQPPIACQQLQSGGIGLILCEIVCWKVREGANGSAKFTGSSLCAYRTNAFLGASWPKVRIDTGIVAVYLLERVTRSPNSTISLL